MKLLPQPIKVLLVEDSMSDTCLLQATLSQSEDAKFEIATAETLAESLDTLSAQNKAFDIILLDLNLPDCDGLTTCKNIIAAYPDIPVVILTSLGSEDLANEAIQAGAQDFIFKHRLDTYWLSHAVKYSINRFALLRRQHQAEQNLMKEVATARAGSQSKTSFLAHMSHEIRTPISSVVMATESLLCTPGLNPEQLALANVMHRSGAHLLELVNDILDLSKVEAGQLSIEELAINPTGIIQETIALLQPIARKKQLDFVSKLVNLPDTIFTDPKRLKQILTNLVTNAIKFNDSGTITVKAFMVKDSLEIYVSDTGCGLSPEEQRSLFLPFSQAKLSTARIYGGTGLGLCLAKVLAKALGGDVELIQSTPTQGSTFKMNVLVSAQQDHPNCFAKGQDVSGNEPHTLSLSGFHILLAEDNRDIQLLIKSILEFSGATVDLANNGQEVIAAALQAEYSLILMDMQMPILDGYQSTRSLRNAGYTKPILALTASAFDEERHKALAAGCNSFLAKPATGQELVKAILATGQRK